MRLLTDWDGFRTRMLAIMGPFDLILCPTSPGPADLHGQGVETMFHDTLPFSLTGSPAWSFPLAAHRRACLSACRSSEECGEKMWRSPRPDGLRRRLEAGQATHLMTCLVISERKPVFRALDALRRMRAR